MSDLQRYLLSVADDDNAEVRYAVRRYSHNENTGFPLEFMTVIEALEFIGEQDPYVVTGKWSVWGTRKSRRPHLWLEVFVNDYRELAQHLREAIYGELEQDFDGH